MHAEYACRRSLTILVLAMSVGISLTASSASAGETTVAANPSSGDITLSPKTAVLTGRRATQQMIATSRALDGSVQRRHAFRAMVDPRSGDRHRSPRRDASRPRRMGPPRSSPDWVARNSKPPCVSRGWIIRPR